MAQFASNPFQVVYLFSNKKITIYPTVALNLSHLINLMLNNFDSQIGGVISSTWYNLDIYFYYLRLYLVFRL